MNKVVVVLLRGENMKPRRWEHSDLRSAQRRAHALADLHSVRVSTRKPYELMVDATEFYKNDE